MVGSAGSTAGFAACGWGGFLLASAGCAPPGSHPGFARPAFVNRPFAFNRPFVRPAFVTRPVAFNRPFFFRRHHRFPAGAFAAGLVGGAALGALAYDYPYYGYPYDGGYPYY